MEKLKALLTAEVDNEIVGELERYLDIEYAGWYLEQRILSKEEMAKLVIGKDIVITSYDPITRDVIDASGKLKLIVCTRANPVNIDVSYCEEKNILVSYAPGRNSDCTAEFTVALMLAATRHIPQAHMDLHIGKHCAETVHKTATDGGLRRDVTWELGRGTPYLEYKGFQLHGHTLGIIGYGSIGRRVAKICAAFGMRILVFSHSATPDKVEEYITLKPFDEVLAQSDIITLHCKDTPEMEKLMNAEAFRRMKKTAYFINTSRGALVDEKALIEALRLGEIAGAALDVYDSEPIAKDHPFLTELSNVVTTPHLAGATWDAIANHTTMLVADVKHYLAGEPLEYQYRVQPDTKRV